VVSGLVVAAWMRARQRAAPSRAMPVQSIVQRSGAEAMGADDGGRLPRNREAEMSS